MKCYKGKTKSEQEDFLKELCRTHGSFICAVLRKMGNEGDILCRKILKELKKKESKSPTD